MIEVYALKIPTLLEDILVDRLMRAVSPEQRERLGRMHSRDEVRRSVLAELLLRALVAERRGDGGSVFAIERGDYGKPYLRHMPGLQFALSHAGRWVVCALDNHPVGVDVEEKRPLADGYPENFFSPQERSELNRLAGIQQRDRFFAMWTLKESAGKATGKGLSSALVSWTLRYLPGGSIRLEENGLLIPHMFLRTYDLEASYSLAVCGAHPHFAPAVRLVPAVDIITRFVGGMRHA